MRTFAFSRLANKQSKNMQEVQEYGEMDPRTLYARAAPRQGRTPGYGWEGAYRAFPQSCPGGHGIAEK
jgi:hypothetical protein